MSVTIEPIMLDHILHDLSARIDHAVVDIDGTKKRYQIHNTIVSGRSLRKYVYVQESDAIGKTILGVSLEDKDGNVLANQPMKIIKNEKGFLIGFEFAVEVKPSV
ncbi:hypothetical protein [Paenibacillus alvei]|uniref:Uncharacterized protein n=1 Tax=Paenibacillus alvei TaxID=44250 RepID=A0AAP7DKP5_PAEAL|nr:hypothetical protein [Paenibacillus alvei]NEZ40257.1 hypothetical protein [Paenibacillus alvei]NOJ73210.1 hypothetical protein [Paenibacillus alvei]